MNAYQKQINDSKTLGELADTLNSISSELREQNETTIDQVVDTTSLPTFGGADVKSTSEVWSWDANNLLVADGSKWSLEPRCSQCGEATFHCKH
jgi:hypothetical protein